MKCRLLLVFAFVLFCIPHVSAAQIFNGPNISLTSEPPQPNPGEEVTLTLDAYTLDMVGADISWYVNDTARPEAHNETTLTLNAGELGTNQTIAAVVTLRDNSTYRTSHTISSTRTNLTIEAQTHTPYFYKGRAEPSTGSTIRAISVPETGSGATPSAYSYRWEVNGKVLFGGPVQGRNVVTFDIPFASEAHIRLDVLDPTDGHVVASSNEYVPIVKPEVHFYEHSLLLGESHNAVGSTFNLIGDETNIKAEPYFINNKDLTQEPKLAWKIDGSTTENPNPDPFTITLRKTGGTGSAKVYFSARSTKALSQFAENSFTISF